MKKYAAGGKMNTKGAMGNTKTRPPSPSDDLVPPSMLPDKPGIPPGKGFGEDIPRKKEEKPKKMRSGGSVSSASKRADGCAVKGKTRGKMV
jgi:hypothetical protein